MKTTFSVSQAKANLPKITKSDQIVAITDHNEIAGFYVPRERLEALLETMEILANPEAMKAVRKYEAGKMKFKTLAETKRELEATA